MRDDRVKNCIVCLIRLNMPAAPYCSGVCANSGRGQLRRDTERRARNAG